MVATSDSPSSLWVTGEDNGFPRPFGNYLLLAAFAQGGMGELFLAMNGSIAGAFRLCVVKKLRADLTNDKEYVNRFVDEARVVVQLNHANISHVFDIGRIDGQYYLAMEYVSGVSVKRLMARAAELDEQIPEDIAIFIAREVLEALDYAHAHTHPITGEALHVVHRDVSPQNMLVSWAGEVKLIDFGLALSALKDEHTATGAVMGKVAYMPPEQARGDEVTAACDQFATAVVTYEMMASERYHGDLPLHAIWAIAGMGNFPPPKWSVLPRELQIILQRALHNDPYQRYPTCGDLREALGAFMAAHHPASGERNLRELLDRWFKEYRSQERELLSRFKDVTGQKIREAVKNGGTEAESLLSGPHKRPEPQWTLPPTEADAKSISDKNDLKKASQAGKPGSGSKPSSPSQVSPQSPLPTTALPAPAPPIQPPMMFSLSSGRLDESRSLPLMPAPKTSPSEQSAAQLAAAAASLLSPGAGALSTSGASTSASPLGAAIELTPLAPPLGAQAQSAGALSTVGESTERFVRNTGAPAPLATLTPRTTSSPGGLPAVTLSAPPNAGSLGTAPVVAESTAAFMKASGASMTPAPLTPRAQVGEPTERFQRGAAESVAALGTLTPTPRNTIGEPTERFMKSANAATTPQLQTLTPTAQVAQTTEQFMRSQGAGGPVLVAATPSTAAPTPSPSFAPPTPLPSFPPPSAGAIQPPAPSTTSPARPSVNAVRSNHGPMGTSAAVTRDEPTMRVRKRDDEEEPLDFDPARAKPKWPVYAGAAAVVVVVVAAVAIGISSKTTDATHDPSHDPAHLVVDPNAVRTNNGNGSNGNDGNGNDGNGNGAFGANGTGANNGNGGNDGSNNGNNGGGVNANGNGGNGGNGNGNGGNGNGGTGSASSNGGNGGSHTKPHNSSSGNSGGNSAANSGGNTGANSGGNTGANSGGNTGANSGGNTGANSGGNTDAAPEEAREAKRARDRVSTLKRSQCKDPCVGRIVGQLETMPNAVALEGFRTSVDACIDACR